MTQSPTGSAATPPDTAQVGIEALAMLVNEMLDAIAPSERSARDAFLMGIKGRCARKIALRYTDPVEHRFAALTIELAMPRR